MARLATSLTSVQETETVSLHDALGRVSADDRLSPIDLPPFASSAMDGVALRGEELRQLSSFRIVGTALAGHPFDGQLGPGEAVRIFTGAVVPDALDTVVIQEDLELSDTEARIVVPPEPGANVRSAGNDVKREEAIVRAGERLNPFRLGALYAAGVERLRVRRRLRVAVFSTGDELIAPGIPLKPGQIYDSNRFMLAQLLDGPAIDWHDAGVLRDEPDEITATLKRLGQTHDIVLTSGGVSVGDADFVRTSLEQVGSIEFYRLNLKPGKPLAYGTINRDDGSFAHFFGLPGNPVSTLVTSLLVVLPSLRRLAGETDPPAPLPVSATARTAFEHRPGREEYQRGFVTTNGADGLEVRSAGDQGSNRLMSFVNANALVRIPAESATIAPGDTVDVFLLSGTLTSLVD